MRYSHVMSDIQTAIEAAIKVTLARSGRSQASLAREIGMSPAWISNRLTGRQPFDTRDLDTVARGLGLADAFDLIRLARAEQARSQAA